MRQILHFILLSICGSSVCFATENVVYILRQHTVDRMTPAQNSFASLKNHYRSINILIPQAYKVDQNGVVSGMIDQDVLDFANNHSVKLMPLITNAQFNKEISHQFLLNKSAQKNAIASILELCTKHHFYGVQFDFEMITFADRDALTQFYLTAAEALHKKGLVVSFAIAPLVSAPPQPSEFLRKIYLNWEGAYDLKKLGRAADFVSLMTYNQHGAPTTPGPTASISWVKAAVKYALRFIPAQKISLGIPDYSTHWFTGDASGKIAVQSVGLSYEKAIDLIHRYNAKLRWDDEAQINFVIFEHDWLNEYVFLENKKSFKAKLALVKKYHLRGISIFDLGTEDASIWQSIR